MTMLAMRISPSSSAMSLARISMRWSRSASGQLHQGGVQEEVSGRLDPRLEFFERCIVQDEHRRWVWTRGDPISRSAMMTVQFAVPPRNLGAVRGEPGHMLSFEHARVGKKFPDQQHPLPAESRYHDVLVHGYAVSLSS